MVTKEQRKRWNKTAYEKRRNDKKKWERELENQRKRYAKFGRKKYPNLCIVCNKEFYSVRSDRKFCSRECLSGGKYNGRWKGGKYMHISGYIFVFSPYHPHKNKNNYVLEHRLVIEKKLERFLKPEESVHHINGIKDDNRIENLMLFENESEHQKYHWKEKKSK